MPPGMFWVQKPLYAKVLPWHTQVSAPWKLTQLPRAETERLSPGQGKGKVCSSPDIETCH